MCCQTHYPAYVFKGSLLVQAEEAAFRCQCPCLGCPRRATGEDLRCDVCRDPAAVTGGMPPWGRAAGREGFYYEAGFFEAEAPQPLAWGWDPAPEAAVWRTGEPAESLRLSPGAQGRIARMVREGGGEGLPAGGFPVVNGVARAARREPGSLVRLDPQQFAADNFHVDGGSPLA